MAAKWSVPGYAEVRELGSGATGRVVLARHTGSGRPVAIKYLSKALVREAGFLDRFRREAETLARLRDPHIVRLLDYVEAREGAAIVMEPIEGPSLRRLLAGNGPCPPEVALTVLHGSLLGLAAAHAHGVVHRDYKPENVLIDAAGQSKLADFGIAVSAGRSAPGLGTPAYMAPEQWNGLRATPATDMYAATVVFYECLVGERPFASDTPAGLRTQHESAPVPLERAPEAVRPLLALGLSKDPGRRYQDVPSFVAHLERAAAAGYGADWKERGTRDLAVAAAVLIAAFPLLAMGAAGGGAAGFAGAAGGGAVGHGAAQGVAQGAANAARSGGAAFHGSGGAVAGHAGRETNRLGRTLFHLGSATGKVKAVAAVLALAAVATTTTVVVANVVPAGGSSKPATSATTPLVAGPAPGTPSSPAGGESSAAVVPPSTPSDSGAPTDTSSAAGAVPGPGSTSSVVTTSTSSAVVRTPVTPTTAPTTPTTPPTTPTIPMTPTTPSPTLTITVKAAADHPIRVVDCAKDPVTSFTGTVTASQNTAATAVWVRSDGSKSAPQQLNLVAGRAATVTDQTWDPSGSGSPRPTGSAKLVVTAPDGTAFSSAAASYTISCAFPTITTSDVSATGCQTTWGKVTFNVAVHGGAPNSTLRWYWYLTFTNSTPATLQGTWSTLQLDARGNGSFWFWGSSNVTNDITGSVFFDPMDGGAPYSPAAGVTAHLTCS